MKALTKPAVEKLPLCEKSGVSMNMEAVASAESYFEQNDAHHSRIENAVEESVRYDAGEA